MKTFTLLIMICSFLLGLNAQEKVNSPVLISPVNGSQNLMVNSLVNWGPVSGAIKYEVQFDTNPAFVSPIVHFTQLSALNPNNLKYGQLYNWRVRAIGMQADTSAWSNVWTFSIIDKTSSVWPANNFNLIPIYPRLRWARISGSTGYLVQIDTVASFNSSFLKNIYTNSPDTSLSVNLGYYGQDYYFRIKAYHSSDTSSWSNITYFKTREFPPLMTPTNASINVTPVEILQFKGIKGSVSYQYQYSQVSDFSSSTIINVPITAESIHFPGTVNEDTVVFIIADTLKYGANFYWRARALSSLDTSAWSPHFTMQIVPAVSSLSEPINGAVGVTVWPTFTWNTIRGTRYYELVFSEDSLFGTFVSTIVNHPANFDATISYKIIHPPLKYQTKYFWKVRAYNYRYSADFSQISNFTTTSPTNIEKRDNLNSLSIYPNPAVDNFNFSVNSSLADDLSLIVTNVLGQVVQSEVFSLREGKNQFNVQCNNLRSGIYFLNFNFGNEKTTLKLIVN